MHTSAEKSVSEQYWYMHGVLCERDVVQEGGETSDDVWLRNLVRNDSAWKKLDVAEESVTMESMDLQRDKVGSGKIRGTVKV